MARMRIQLRGIEQVQRRLQHVADTTARSLAAALTVEAEAIMGKSKEIVPVDTGALRSTGHVQPPETAGAQVTVEMGYGGPAAPYAVFVHERVELRHNPPTQAKFLEQPALEAIPGMAERVAARIRPDVEGVS